MALCKISDVDSFGIHFEDGSVLTYEHYQDCCEHNYADFEQIDDIALNTVFDTEALVFEHVPGSGFRFGNAGKMFFVPCYSEQNGYYTDEITLIFNDKEIFVVECELVSYY